MHYALALLSATHLPTVPLHTHKHAHATHTHAHAHTHTHTHTHKQSGLVPLAVTLGSYSYCFPKSYMCMNVHTCAHTHTCIHTYMYTHARTHTHTHTHTHTDWACTTCRDCGFLFLILFSQIVHVHECTTLCTHTRSHIHAHIHTCTHTHTQTGLVPLAETLSSFFSHCFHKVYMCMNYTRLCTHT